MSEEEKKEEKNDVIGDNVAILKSQIIGLEKLNTELTMKLAEVTEKYRQAKEFVDNDLKKDLLADIAPRIDIPKELLVLKTVDELKDIKKVLDVARVPAFKSGTPISYDTGKNSPRVKLDNMFAENMAKLRGGN